MTPRPDSRTVAWVDASSGASCDLLLGALVSAGVPEGVIVEAVDKVAPGQVALEVAEVRREGLVATQCQFELADPAVPRTWRDVELVLAGAGLHEDVRSLAHDVLSRLAEAEGRVHGLPAEEAPVQELGAPDAVAEVVGVCAGVVQLSLGRVVVSELSVGGGRVSSGHDRLPVPPPAVVELLRDLTPVDAGQFTPTGAALLATLADDWGPQPDMSVSLVGVGTGGRDPEAPARLLRLVVGTTAEARGLTGNVT